MKKHFKLILAALSAFLLFLTNVPVANAAEGDSAPSKGGNTYTDSNDREWLYYGTAKGVDTNGNTQTYHLYSDSLLGAYKDGNRYRLLISNPVRYELITRITNADGFVTMGKSDGAFDSTKVYFDFSTGSDWSFTVPLFGNRQDLLDYMNTGDSSTCINPDSLPDKDWAYSGTISATDSIVSSVEDRTYSLCSDGRLAILNEEEYVYQLYTGTGSAIYEESGGSLTKLSVDGVLWYNLFPMTKYNHYVSTIPIFKSREKLLNYIETGSYDGCINGNDLVFTGDTGFFLQKVAFHPVADGTGTMYFTWSNEQDYGNAEVEIFGDYSITLGLSKMGIRADLTRCPYSEGTYIFTYGEMQQTIVDTGRLEQKFLDKLAQTMIQPHYFYLRLVAEDGRMSGWVRVSAIPEAGTISYGVDTGFIDTDGNFVPNNELQDSYTSVPDPWTGKHDYEDSDKEVNGTQSMLDALSKFVDIIGSLIKSMGSVPELVKKVFGFLPNIFFVLIGGSFTVVVILRILGR